MSGFICKQCQHPLGTAALITDDEIFDPERKYIFYAVSFDFEAGTGEIFCPNPACHKESKQFFLRKVDTNAK